MPLILLFKTHIKFSTFSRTENPLYMKVRLLLLVCFARFHGFPSRQNLLRQKIVSTFGFAVSFQDGTYFDGKPSANRNHRKDWNLKQVVFSAERRYGLKCKSFVGCE